LRKKFLCVKTRAATPRTAKIDCPSFGKRLVCPDRLLNADEFSAFPADITSNQKNAVEM
jgi:hypothetical protein